MTSGWESVALGNVLRMELDSVPVIETENYNMSGVYSFGRGLMTRAPLNGSETTYKTLNRLHENQFVISQLKAWEGAIARVTAAHEGWFLSPVFSTFQVIEDKLDIRYLEWFCKQSYVWDRLKNKSRGMGARRDSVSPSRFLSLEIPLPPLEEQRRIVARVEALAARIEEARGLRESLMYTFRQLLGAEFNRVSVSAIYRPLGEIAPAVRRTVQLELHRKYKEVGARSFGKGLFVKPDFDAAEATWQKPVWLEQGDVVLSNIKAWEGAIAVAKPEHHLHIASHRYITLVPTRDVVDANFLCFYLLTSEGLERIGSASPGTADRNRTTGLRALEQIRVPVPPLQKQKQFVKLLESQNAVRDLQTSTRLELDALLPAVLAKAFAGEL